MSITRIGEVQAKSETIDDLRDFLLSIIPLIKASEGCEDCQLYQSQLDAAKFIMFEVWESIESHQASVKNIPAELLNQIGPLLGQPPTGGYFDLISS
jgi:quinol monooxygenase YgiN